MIGNESNQYGISTRDLTQVGRDFVRKNFELNIHLDKKTKSKLAEFEYYIDHWQTIDSFQKVNIVLHYIKGANDSKKKLDEKRRRINLGCISGCLPMILWGILGITLIYLSMLSHPIYSDTVVAGLLLRIDALKQSSEFIVDAALFLASNIPLEEEQTIDDNAAIWISFSIFMLLSITSLIVDKLANIYVRKIISQPFENQVVARFKMARILFSLLTREEQNAANDYIETKAFLNNSSDFIESAILS